MAKHNLQQHLTSFCHAVQTGSISKAADRMDLSQPTVSLQIQQLESELDTLLFERRGPKISITHEGELLYQMALPLVEGFEHLLADLQAKRGLMDQGEINIAAGESASLYILPKLLSQFAEQFPGIRVRIHEGGGVAGIQLLREGTVDFALGSFRTSPPDDMIYSPTFSYPQVLITPLDHPLTKQQGHITIESLADYPFIMPPRHLNTYSMLDFAFTEAGAKPHVIIEGAGWAMIKRCVMANAGIAIVSGVCLDDRGDIYQHPLEQFEHRTYGMILRRGKVLSPQAKALLKLIDPKLAATRA